MKKKCIPSIIGNRLSFLLRKIGYSKYLKILLSPSTYLSNSYIDELKSDLSEVFFGYEDDRERFFLTENGRTAFYLFLQSLDLDEGSQIAVQPFTCNSAINPVIWNDLQPVYIDIDIGNLSMDPAQLELALSKPENKIRAVLLQHTFGIPADIERIKEICDKHGLLLIEDCAHSIGGEFKDAKLGTYGDCAIISFGLEKNLPTKVGGALLVNNDELIGGVASHYAKYKPVGAFRTVLWLLNPLIRIFARKTGTFGKWLIDLLEKLHLFEIGFTEEELSGGMPSRYPKKISRPIARVAEEYLHLLQGVLDKRVRDSSEYRGQISSSGLGGCLQTDIVEGVPYLKFPFYANDYDERESLQSFLIKSGYYLSDWYENAVYPAGTDHKALYYENGSCPVAEKVCQTIINLPTGDPFSKDIVSAISKFYGSTNRK